MTRARVLNYWTKHGPCSIMQVCRVTGAERSHVYRILKGRYGPLWKALDAGMGEEATRLPLAA